MIKKLFTVNRHDIALTTVNCRLKFPDPAAVRAKKKILIRRNRFIILYAAAFKIEPKSGIARCPSRNNIDDAADGISTVLCACRTADDLDALYIFRAESLQLIRLPAVFRKVAHNGLPVHEDQCMPRFGTANGYSTPPHGVDATRHARFTENDILDGLGLLSGNILLSDNRRALAFRLGRFLSRIDLDNNISRFNPTIPSGRTFRRTNRHAQPSNDGTGQ